MIRIKKVMIILTILVIYIKISYSLNEKSKIKLASRAMAKIVDHLSDEYYMRFTVTLIGDDVHHKDLIDEFMFFSNSTFVLKYVPEDKNVSLNETFALDDDVPNILIYNLRNGSIVDIPRQLSDTKLVTYRNKLTLIYNMKDYDQNIFVDPEFQQSVIDFPHDYYFLVHDSNDPSSIILLNNELFFNRTCDQFFHPINYFNSLTSKWSDPRIFIQYHQFYHCEVNMSKDQASESVRMSDGAQDDQSIVKSSQYLELIRNSFAAKHNISFTLSFTANSHMNVINFACKRWDQWDNFTFIISESELFKLCADEVKRTVLDT